MKVVTAAILFNDQGHVLLCRRAPDQSHSGNWEFPGGKREEGETLAQCLERELQEELQIVCKVGAVLAESEYHYDHGSIHLIAMRTQWISGEIQLTVHDRMEWVPVDALETYELSPADIPIAQKLPSIL
jgi:8-oxo-dGTP diphosphatase